MNEKDYLYFKMSLFIPVIKERHMSSTINETRHGHQYSVCTGICQINNVYIHVDMINNVIAYGVMLGSDLLNLPPYKPGQLYKITKLASARTCCLRFFIPVSAISSGTIQGGLLTLCIVIDLSLVALSRRYTAITICYVSK